MQRLPDWIGIGCVKCGTSWTWRELRKHPQLFAPNRKEIRFFNHRPTKSLKWYLNLFAQAKPGQKIGEFTPDYFHHYEAMHCIKDESPKTKLITIFRHPIERAFSNWKHALFEGRLKEGTTFDQSFGFWRVRDRSVYSTHLKTWWRLFPKEQLKIMWYEDIQSNPQKYLKEIYQFVGVDDTFVSEDHNKWFNFKYHKDEELNEAILPDNVRKKWLTYYLKYTEELEKMTGKDLNSWKV